MSDAEFLAWIHDRMIDAHGENENCDYMHKLRSVITRQVENEALRASTAAELATLWASSASVQADQRAELDRLTAERDALRNDVHSCHPGCSRAGCVNERLRAEVEELRADAERWRFGVKHWMFPEFCSHDNTIAGMSWYMPTAEPIAKFSTANAAIDAARKDAQL